MGLFSRVPDEFLSENLELKAGKSGVDVKKIEILIARREAARKSKEWAEADRCRDELTGMGVVFKDNPNGKTEWKL